MDAEELGNQKETLEKKEQEKRLLGMIKAPSNKNKVNETKCKKAGVEPSGDAKMKADHKAEEDVLERHKDLPIDVNTPPGLKPEKVQGTPAVEPPKSNLFGFPLATDDAGNPVKSVFDPTWGGEFTGRDIQKGHDEAGVSNGSGPIFGQNQLQKPKPGLSETVAPKLHVPNTAE